MPGKSGFELCRIVKQTRPDVRLILMTAFKVSKSEFDKVLPSTKVDGFIKKPLTINKLAALL
jgi:response regulator RpfG family c-di-GMP phosphodiesterase